MFRLYILNDILLQAYYLCIAYMLSPTSASGSGAHRLEILETNCMDNYYPNTIHLLPGEHEKILRRVEVEWGKVPCWSAKVAISLKPVEIEEKLLWRAYRNSPSLNSYGLFPRLGVRNQLLLSQERVRLWTSNLAVIFIGSIRTKGH